MSDSAAVEHPGDLEIKSVEVLGDQALPPGEALPSHKPAIIRISYAARVSIDRVHMSLFVKRSDGLTCCMMRTSLNGGPFGVRAGDGVITVHLERLQLISGSYSVDAYF
jgi:hypothetical protein